ncbi:MAG: crosslink repair DNA glycosylase YcaQ family protein [Herbinix sp.]|nr:crosslink repair DNA glycosylase YcaQ family protein [Herbinix sp.]
MDSYTLTKEEAKRFILTKQGLLGEYKFTGKDGVLSFVEQAGCIQFDPIDVCGKNAELVLQSRVKGFTKKMLYELLYEERKLFDYYDKNLAIMNISDWKYLDRIRQSYRNHSRGREEVDKVAPEIIKIIERKGPVSSKELDLNEKVDWYWSSTRLGRAALETLYFRGDLIVHHKQGTNKYYALAKDYLPKDLLEAKEPFPKELDHMKWCVLRRISAVGLLWNKPSDAWLGINNLKSAERNEIFGSLLDSKEIIEINVLGIKDKLYCLTKDKEVLDKLLSSDTKPKERTELIAPLDSLMWDRKLIKALFDFEYKWEIYTPLDQRKFGYYVLPILSGHNFIGRIETLKDMKNDSLLVKNIWYEENVKISESLRKSIEKCLRRFMKFHNLKEIGYITPIS